MRFSFQIALILIAGFVASLAGVTSSSAQSAENITLELNKIEPVGNDCLLTFVVSSKSAKNLNKLAYEFVVFDDQFRVQRMTVFDFRELEAGKLRVRQFQLPETKCEGLGRLLINDVSSCDGSEVDASLCTQGLTLTNKTKIEFLN
ncbi:MAG: hypothetical protein AAGA53_05485 [Pseudomonadota bacterium]